MTAFSHHGHRLRRDIIPVIGHPEYFLVRLRNGRGQRKLKKIETAKSDPDRRPFKVDFEIRRKLRARGSKGFGKPLKFTPKRSKWNRWDLVVKIKKASRYLHRLVGLSATPLCTDTRGFEVEPRFITKEEASLFEVHHPGDDNKQCTADALHVLFKEYHRSLRRGA